MKIKSKNIPEDLLIQGNTRDRSFCFSHLTSITHLHLIEIGPLQPRERCLPNFLKQQNGYAFPPFCLIGRVLKKVQLDQATLIVVTPEWQTQSWYPQLLQMSIKNLLLLPSISNLSIGPNKQNHQLIEKQNLQLLAWTILGKSYLQKDY